jgi:hypothetical protein
MVRGRERERESERESKGRGYVPAVPSTSQCPMEFCRGTCLSGTKNELLRRNCRATAKMYRTAAPHSCPPRCRHCCLRASKTSRLHSILEILHPSNTPGLRLTHTQLRTLVDTTQFHHRTFPPTWSAIRRDSKCKNRLRKWLANRAAQQCIALLATGELARCKFQLLIGNLQPSADNRFVTTFRRVQRVGDGSHTPTLLLDVPLIETRDCQLEYTYKRETGVSVLVVRRLGAPSEGHQVSGGNLVLCQVPDSEYVTRNWATK